MRRSHAGTHRDRIRQRRATTPGRRRTARAASARWPRMAALARCARCSAWPAWRVGAVAAALDLRGDRAGCRVSQPARDRQPHRLPAEAADARLLGRRRAARRVRRGAAQLHADRRDPEGDEGRRAGGRGRALLPARRRRLRGRASAPAWPTSAKARSARAPRPSRCRWRATSICRPRKHLLARSTRCCWRFKIESAADARTRSSRST